MDNLLEFVYLSGYGDSIVPRTTPRSKILDTYGNSILLGAKEAMQQMRSHSATGPGGNSLVLFICLFNLLLCLESFSAPQCIVSQWNSFKNRSYQ
jgi:hypothetical protein